MFIPSHASDPFECVEGCTVWHFSSFPKQSAEMSLRRASINISSILFTMKEWTLLADGQIRVSHPSNRCSSENWTSSSTQLPNSAREFRLHFRLRHNQFSFDFLSAFSSVWQMHSSLVSRICGSTSWTCALLDSFWLSQWQFQHWESSGITEHPPTWLTEPSRSRFLELALS